MQILKDSTHFSIRTMRPLIFLSTILFVTIFVMQFYNIVDNYYNPSTTRTSKYHEDLNDMEFPILLKVCIQPGYNWGRLREYGYESDFHFFLGLNQNNKSTIGYFGHFQTLTSNKLSVFIAKF